MRLRNSISSYGLIAIVFHWLSAVVIFGMFALGWWMVDLTYYDSWYQAAPDLHKSIGITLLALILLRLVWKWANPKPAAMPEHSRFEKIAAYATHWLLYLNVIVVMVAGYLITTADGSSIEVFGLFEVPAILPAEKGREDTAGAVHWYAALVLVSLAAVHAGAALKHHFLDKDRTLQRIVTAR